MYHPQSNRQAERFVGAFKRAMPKAEGDGTSEEILNHCLLVYRTTSHPTLRPLIELKKNRRLNRFLEEIHPQFTPPWYQDQIKVL